MVAAADPTMEEVTSLAEEAEEVDLAADADILEAAVISIGVITVATVADAILAIVVEDEATHTTIIIIVAAATAAIIMDLEMVELSIIITMVATVQSMRQMATVAMQCAAHLI